MQNDANQSGWRFCVGAGVNADCRPREGVGAPGFPGAAYTYFRLQGIAAAITDDARNLR